MAFVKLVSSNDPRGAAFAQGQLQSTIDRILNVALIVYGDGPEQEEIVSLARELASSKPEIRDVVHCPDPSVLSPEQKRHYFRNGKTVVAIGLQDKVAKALGKTDALDLFELDLAFLAAEAQKPTGPNE
jgi:hypothetical protein